jgi:hypothetical protein
LLWFQVSNRGTYRLPLLDSFGLVPWDMAKVFKPWRWMHLEAKRLTGKYRASKMFRSLYF